MTEYRVTLRFQFPAWDEQDGIAAWLTKAAAWMDRNPPPSRPSAPPG
jgi:hypothetical protein